MAFECIAIPTNETKRRKSFEDLYGTSFRVKYFGLSASGHNPTTPSVALVVDPSATTMPGGAPLFGPAPITGYRYLTDFCPSFICKLQAGEYQGYVSSIGLFAEIVYVDPSDPSPPSVGYTFLYAVCNRPLVSLTNVDAPEFDVSLYF